MYIKAKVTTEAKRDSLTKFGRHFLITVKEKAVRNLANNKARELVGEHFGVPGKTVRIVAGHRSPAKIFSLDIEKAKPPSPPTKNNQK